MLQLLILCSVALAQGVGYYSDAQCRNAVLTDGFDSCKDLAVPRWVTIKANTTCLDNKVFFCASYKCGVCEIQRYEFNAGSCNQVPGIPQIYVKAECPSGGTSPSGGQTPQQSGGGTSMSPLLLGSIGGGVVVVLAMMGFLYYWKTKKQSKQVSRDMKQEPPTSAPMAPILATAAKKSPELITEDLPAPESPVSNRKSTKKVSFEDEKSSPSIASSATAGAARPISPYFTEEYGLPTQTQDPSVDPRYQGYVIPTNHTYNPSAIQHYGTKPVSSTLQYDPRYQEQYKQYTEQYYHYYYQNGYKIDETGNPVPMTQEELDAYYSGSEVQYSDVQYSDVQYSDVQPRNETKNHETQN
jgi:hypothetical protein